MDKQDAMQRGLHPFVGPPTTFEAVFPMIGALDIVLEVRKEGAMQPNPSVRNFTLEDPPGEFIRCPRGSSCRDGGWHIAGVLREMVDKRETSRRATGRCEGRETGRGPSPRCVAYFIANIQITYKDEQGKTELGTPPDPSGPLT
jgi:hypothetical protein